MDGLEEVISQLRMINSEMKSLNDRLEESERMRQKHREEEDQELWFERDERESGMSWRDFA